MLNNIILKVRIERGQEELGDWNWHIYTIETIDKIDNQWESTVWHRELYLILCGDWMGRKSKRERICVYQIDGETVETVSDFIFLGSKITADGDSSHEIKRRLLLGRKAMTNLDSILKTRDITLSTNVHLNQGHGFSSGHVLMWELNYKESWELKNWCFWTVVLEKTLKSPLDYKEIQPVHPKGDQSWVFIGRTDVEAETPILWPPDAKSWLI